jgi:hypothetical protein
MMNTVVIVFVLEYMDNNNNKYPNKKIVEVEMFG